MTRTGVRAAALAAALVLAVLSRGDAITLAALLAVGAWRPLPIVGIVSALAAAAWRWSSTALEDIAGAQAVLGPAGVVDPASAAIAAWLGALAIVLATPDLVDAPQAGLVVLTWLPPVAFGATAAVIVAGPAPGGEVWARLLAAVVATALAAWISRPGLRGRLPAGPSRRFLEVAAATLGLASLAAVAIDSPELDGLFDRDAFVEGLALGVAAGALAWTVGAVVIHQRGRPEP